AAEAASVAALLQSRPTPYRTRGPITVGRSCQQGPWDLQLARALHPVAGELIHEPAGRFDLIRDIGGASESRWARWHGQHLALVGTHQLPAALVRHPVVAVAQEDHVREVGLAALGPMDDMVSVAPGCRPVAARPLAMTVAGVEGATRG